MKILVVSQYFYPENFKSNDIAFELSKRGHQVTVITGIPNYPEGKYFAGYNLFKRRREYINNVRIIRIPLIPRGKGGSIGLALNYFSFALLASLYAFLHSFRNKYDAIIGHGTSPISQCFPGIVVRRMQHIPLYTWVLDLWPESLTSAGNVHNPKVLAAFTAMVKYIYNRSDKILISSEGFRRSILEKGDYASKIIYFPNWAEDVFSRKTNYPVPALPEGFRVMFAGNVGEAQDFDTIMQAALKLKDEKDIHFIIVGDGRKSEWVKYFTDRNKLHATVHLMGRYPLEAMPSFFSEAGIMLVSLKDELIFNLTVPAKLQAYMAFGKPVLAMLNGEGAEIVTKARCGLTIPASDADKLAAKIKEARALTPIQRTQMGKNAQTFFNTHYQKDKCITHLLQIIEEGTTPNHFKISRVETIAN